MVGIRAVGPAVAITMLVIVAPSLYLAGCAGRVAPQQAPTPRPLPQLKAVGVRLGDRYFDPKTIAVPAGEAVRLVLKNEGRALHTFTIDELGIIVRLAPAGSEKST